MTDPSSNSTTTSSSISSSSSGSMNKDGRSIPTIRLKWMNTASESSSALPQRPTMLPDIPLEYTLQQLQDHIFQMIESRNTTNNGSTSTNSTAANDTNTPPISQTHISSSSFSSSLESLSLHHRFDMNFIYKGTILNQKNANHAMSLQELIFPSTTMTDTNTTTSHTDTAASTTTATNSITLYIVLIPKPNLSSVVTNQKRTPRAVVGTTTRATNTTAIPSSSSSSTNHNTNNEISSTNQLLDASSSTTPSSMEQMIQQMILGGNNNSNNNSNTADHPMIRQLQSQFPDHNIRDMIQTILSNPYAQQQMERSLELQLSQLDHVPGGMNLIQNAYQEQVDAAADASNNNTMDGLEDFLATDDNDDDDNNDNSSAFMNLLLPPVNRRRRPPPTNGYDPNPIAGPTGQAMPNPWSNRTTTNRRHSTAMPTNTSSVSSQSSYHRPATTMPTTQNSMMPRQLPVPPTVASFPTITSSSQNTTTPTLVNPNPWMTPNHTTTTTAAAATTSGSNDSTGDIHSPPNPWMVPPPSQARHTSNNITEATAATNMTDPTTTMESVTTTTATTTTDASLESHDSNNNNNTNTTNKNEQLLYEMGFTDRTLNRTMLQENENNLDRTVERLIQRQSQQSPNS
jgi:hypothetical protein